jgi:hypothetical protein
MPQMDKVIFTEYIYWLFLVLVHHYTSFWINMNFIRISVRHFLISFFHGEAKSLRYEEECVKNAYQKFCIRDKWVSLSQNKRNN